MGFMNYKSLGTNNSIYRNWGLIVICFLCSISVLATDKMVTEKQVPSDTISLFNGVNLDGWSGKKDNWFVRDGMIVGSTNGKILDDFSWIVTDKQYRDFELSFWVKLLGDENRNSGIYYRGKWNEEEFVVGYEFDIGGWGDDDELWWGELHDPFGRDIWIGPGKDIIAQTYKPEEWNRVVIKAEGSRIQHWLNGTKMVDWIDEDPTIQKEGFIGLQMHSETAFEVYFKDIQLVQIAGE